MKIIVFAICYNQSDVLPFFLRHYAAFADEISVFDDKSDDGSVELLKACPKVLLRDWPYNHMSNEDEFLKHAYEWYPRAAGKFDWAIWVDCDEFIYHPELMSVLEWAKKEGVEVIKPDGFNMMHEGMPKDDGRQIWEICKMGVQAPVYSKPVIFQPHIHIEWNRGKHALENCNPRVAHNTGVKLLHYRYLGYEYTKAKNAKNYARCDGDKVAAWTDRPDHKGEHSAEWAAKALKEAKEVI